MADEQRLNDLLNKSLDQIISERKQDSKGGEHNRGKRKRAQSTGGGPSSQPRNNRTRPAGTARNGNGRGGAGGTGGLLSRSFRAQRNSHFDDDGDDSDHLSWNNDLYQAPVKRANFRGTSQSGATTLSVSNLNYELTEEDLEELFGEHGSLKSVAIHTDRSGRSLGTAKVVFRNPEDAQAAIDDLHLSTIGDQVMQVVLESDAATSRTLSGGLVVQKRGAALNQGGRVNSPQLRAVRAVSSNASPDLGPRRVVSRPEREAYRPGAFGSRAPRDISMSDGPRNTRQRGGGGGRNNGSSRGGAARGGRSNKTPTKSNNRPRPTEDELNQDLDSYWAQANNSNDAASNES